MTPRRFAVMLLVALACAVSLVWLHCQNVHLCYRIDEVRQDNEQLAAAYVTLDARASQLRQPHLLARRVDSMQLGMVGQFEALPAVVATGSPVSAVQLVHAGRLVLVE